jgi:putative ABC transport system permease protein
MRPLTITRWAAAGKARSMSSSESERRLLLQCNLGVKPYAVNQRTHEIGVRMALGAGRGDVLWLVLREGMRLTAIGSAIGLLIATSVGFGLSHVLYGVEPVDAGVIAGITLLLLAVAALACYLPVRRATRVDPIVALGYE